jgi:Holliday junction resolvasome RuvABC DNA-binding subunit
MPFTPKGDVAEWRMVYDKMKVLRPDEVMTTGQIEEALGRPLGQNRSPVYRAIKEMERNHQRTLATVRGVGYRVALASEHFGLVIHHSDRARTQLRRGVERADSADRSVLRADQAQQLDAIADLTVRAVEFLGHMAKRVDSHAKMIEDVKQKNEELDERVAALEKKDN